jgi:hypothetical protein
MPRFLGAQGGIPDSLRGSALAIRIHAVVPLLSSPPASTAGADESGKDASTSDKSAAQTDKGVIVDSLTGKPIAWQGQSEKYTLPGRPVSFRYIGSNFVVVVQITPFAQDGAKNVTLVAQGQVWVKSPQGGLSYHTAIDTLSVSYCEAIFYYPLGLDASGNSPLRLEISVLRASDVATPSEGGAQSDRPQSDKPPSDKPQGDKQPNDKILPDKPPSSEKTVVKP